MPLTVAGSACAIVSMHIASKGQSLQPSDFCSSGQHGMSADVADMSVITAAGTRFAAAGATNGARARPAITKTASIRPMMRRRFMLEPSHGHRSQESAFRSHVRQRARKVRIWSKDPASRQDLRAQKAHEGPLGVRRKEHHFERLRCSALHSR